MTAGSTPSAAAQVLARDLLHLIILPTEACNFRCTYCYEDFRLARMPEATVRGVEQFLSRRAPGLHVLDISWFGGEPLLARDIIVRLLRHVADLRGAHPSLLFRSDMTTNGYLLTPDLFRELHALGVTRYQVAFDGPPEAHDRKRVLSSGRPSFGRIWDNLLALKSLPLEFTATLRLHIDSDLPAARAFVELARRAFKGDPRFPLFPRLLSRWRADDPGAGLLTGSAGRQALDQISARARSLGMPLYRPAGDSICYAARGNSFLIRADGRVNKCTIALDAPANGIGELTPDGRIILDAGKVTPWLRGLWSGSKEALSCPMVGLVREAGPCR